jgi:hypothetical protein
MATKSGKAFDFASSTVFNALPGELIIWGWNDPETVSAKKDDPAWNPLESHSQKHLVDPRIFEPLDESMIRSIMAKGVRLPVLVCKIDEMPVIKDGRRRVLHTFAANERIKDEGLTIARLVPFVFEKGIAAAAPEEQMLAGLALNVQRKQESVLGLARKARNLNEVANFPLEDIAAQMNGISEDMLKFYIKLLDADQPIQDALESGQIYATQAEALMKFPEVERRTAELAELLDAGKDKISVAKIKAKTKPEPTFEEKQERLKKVVAKLVAEFSVDDVLSVLYKIEVEAPKAEAAAS